MDFKQLKSLKSAKCVLCGKPVNMLKEHKNMAGILDRYSGQELQTPLCTQCFELLRHTKRVNLIAEGGFSPETGINLMNAYKSEKRNLLINSVNSTTLPWMKQEVDSFINGADTVCKQYDSYSQVLQSVYEKVMIAAKQLPEQVVSIGSSTFATDGNHLYYMPYGLPIYHSKELEQIKDIKDRINLTRELTENVLNKEFLIQSITIDNIIYFQEKGDLQYSTDISGGGGGDANIGGAMLGGILFGVAGAIVGSHTGENSKIKAIKSNAVEHDNRYTSIRYIEQNGKTVEKKCRYEYYDVFNELIPEKEYSYIQLHTNASNHDTPSKSNGIPVEELKKLKELLDAGIINEDDFEKTKKRLLQID
ncbi:MAG TPA: hypothetical protein DCW90_08410 [Lachnospiraceae bacterium]|mgnify:CR=1 FL=1|nr:hypothetical protein [Lachnospiraceae bacterium]